APIASTARSASIHAAGLSVRLMKPRPATSAFATRSSPRSFAAIASANARGFAPASLASTMAALVAMSPCALSRGGSTTMRDWSIPAGSTPSATSAFVAARTLSRTAAKTFWSLMLVFVWWRRLTQFRGRVKKPRVLRQRVAVGHAGDKIGDVARARGCIAPVDDLRPFRRHVVGLFQVAGEQRANEALGVAHDAHDAAVAIHPGVKKTLNRAVGLGHLWREGANRMLGMPHVAGRARPQRPQATAGFRDHVLDHLRDEVAHQFMHQSRRIERRVLAANIAQNVADQRNVGEIFEHKKPGAQPVVDVVGVVGDIVGDGGDLGLGTGEAP